MYYQADVARWMSAVAGALLSVMIAAQLGTARAQDRDEVPVATEEPITEVEVSPERPDSSIPAEMADAGRASRGKAGPAGHQVARGPIVPADNELIKCVAGCIGRVGGSVVNLSSNETR
ncbi:MAG TPA: hypothetical protein VG966_05475 [Hyphomicrobiaceae bacterium]|nr:hypothetical protein [Hyphomicrobiaceae bacterium]